MTSEPTTATRESTEFDLIKGSILLSRDLAMLGTASKYNLDDPAEMARSCRDLSRLFFHIAKILDVDLFIEAGAKDAASSRRARRLLDPKRVVAFEANPFTHKRFAAVNGGESGVEYIHMALSETPGTVTFNVLRTDDGTPRADGQASLLKRENEKSKGFVEVTVDATTLDDYFTGHEYDRSAIWVDVEGAARPVLSGGTAVLERAAVVMIEVEDRAFWGAEQWLCPDVVSYLYDRGLVPVARDFQSRYQYNIVFVRTDLLAVDRVRWALTLFTSAGYNKPAGNEEAAPAAARPAPAVAAGAKGVAKRAVRALRSRRQP
jgi:FkbM family methyltransferase